MDEENNGPGPKTIVGENTGKVKTKSNGEEFALVTENANGLRTHVDMVLKITLLVITIFYTLNKWFIEHKNRKNNKNK
jgi:hypothetical protein